jgi:gliding motility-associated-like protein
MNLMRSLALFATVLCVQTGYSQTGFSFTCTRDTTIQGCGAQVCFTLKARVPDIRSSTTSYTVNPVAATGGCFAPVVAPNDPAGTSTNLTVDDRYTSTIPLGFTFPFFGLNYTSLVASTNGYISFDPNGNLASTGAHYGILSSGGSLSATSGTPANLPNALYDPAIIMGVYHDVDPNTSISTSPTKRIQYQVFGVAPYRRWVLSFYKIPLYSSTCNPLIENTSQMVLYESTGIVEVSVFSQQICTSWNQGRAMIGIQDHNGTAGYMAPGRRASDAPWGTLNMNETWRFVPNSGTSQLKRVEVIDMSGNLLATGVAGTGSNGVIPVTFPNLCVSGGATKLVVRSVYRKYAAPTTEIFNYDTVNVIAGFKAAVTPTAPTCTGLGSVLATVPAGQGVAPFTYSLDFGSFQSSGSFTGVPSGSHTVIVKDANCADTVVCVVPPAASITATSATTPSGCSPSGSISITPTSGVAPYTYALDGASSTQTSNSFNNVSAGSHTVTVKDALGCTTIVTVLVGTRTAPSGTATVLPSGCTPSGSINIIPSGGTAPYKYQLGTGAAQTSGTFTGIAAGTYAVTITDSTGCTFTVQSIVVPGSSVSATAVTTPSACNPTGTITVTVDAGTGTPPYSYKLGTNAAQSSNIFSALAAGTYSITVTDGTGCVTTVTANVGTLNTLSATGSSSPSGCSPASGTINITPSGGTAPYSYQLGTGALQASGTFTGIAAGTYTVTVTDAGGCPFPVTVVVAPTAAVNALATSTPAGCLPADGTISMSVTTGTAPYQYAIMPGAPQPQNVFNGVTAGSYSVIVSDAVGCTDTVQVTVAPTPQPAGTPATTLSGCTPSGSITINMTAGTAPYSYALGSAAAQASNTFSNVTAGSYVVHVTDAKGCTLDIPATVGQHPALTATGTTTASGCTPPSGTITITVPAGSGLAPFTYVLDSGSAVASNVFTGVTQGAHIVTVRDAANCSFVVNVVVGSPATLTGTVATTASGCIPSGSVTVSMTAGIGVTPFQYQLDNGAPQASNTFTAVGNGNHSITVTDAVGCTLTLPAVVAATQPLNAGFRSHAPSCDAASNGSLVLVPQNGTAPFQFRLNNGSWQVSDSFPNLAAGAYDLYFRDASGCISSAIPATVAPGVPVTATITQTNVSCFGGSNGSATLTLSSNATAPFTFSTNNFTTSQAGNTISGLGAGSQTIWFKDALGCSNSLQVPITAPTALNGGTPVATNPLCAGAANGTVTLSASGGTAPYQYSFNGSAFQAAPLFNSGAGTFNAVIRDANNCTLNVNGITLAEPAILVIDSVRIRPATCDSNGRVLVYASGGTAAYQYGLNAGSFGSISNFSVATGTYNVTVKDANGCTATANGNVVPQISNLAYVHPVISPMCEGMKATIAPQTNATNFVWTGPGITPNNSSQSSIDVRPARDTFYTLIYSLGSCLQKDTIAVTVRPAPIPDAGTVTPVCFGQDAQLNAAPGYSEYHWSPTTYLSNADVRNPTVQAPNATIRYSLHVKDANGCVSLVSDTVTVQVTPPIIVRISPADTVGYIGDTLHIVANAAANHFQWFNSQNGTPVNIVDPNIANGLILVEKTEVFRVHAWTDQGCAGDGYFYLRAYRGPEIYVPDAFTPNRDGKNDLLRPVCVGIQSLNYFRVFNRWGQLVYEYKGERRGAEVYNLLQSNIGWDGKVNGKEVGTGSYVWIAEGVTKEGKSVSRKGAVTLIQ